MKYTFKILGALPGQDLIEIEVKPTNTILDINLTLQDNFFQFKKL